jgi:squalene synthase HpnC
VEHRRIVAKARTENFPVAVRLLPRRLRRDLLAIYWFARLVDDAGDEGAGDRLARLDGIERRLHEIYRCTDQQPGWRTLHATVRDHDIPISPFLRLIEANRRDQRQVRYTDYADLLDYCSLSANPIGELVLHVFDAVTPERIRLSDFVCTALQLVEHVQDVGEDCRRGRIYLPAADLEQFGCPVSDLTTARTSPPLREVLARQTTRAESLLDQGAPLISSLSGLARAVVAGYLAGGRATVAALWKADHEVLARPVRPANWRIAAEWLRLLGAPAIHGRP